jgi:hypothetical protein
MKFTEFQLSNDEFYSISRQLEGRHAVFYKFWELGAPSFVDDGNLPTAAIIFDKMGQTLNFVFNIHFWKSIDSYERIFIISHEMMHCILNHGVRTCMGKGTDQKAANIAADVVINHLLVKNFNFDRRKLKFIGNEGWWVETLQKYLKIKEAIPLYKSFEYYYNLILKRASEDKSVREWLDGAKGFDIHLIGDAKSLINKLNDSMSHSEKDQRLKDLIDSHFQTGSDGEMGNPNDPAGKGAGYWSFVDPKAVIVKKKKKWESIIFRWAKKKLTYDDTMDETFVPNRRMEEILRHIGEDVTIPTERFLDDSTFKQDKIEVYFFLDTSGSCYGLKDRFWKAAESLPPDKFQIRLFCFDSLVYETTLESRKIYGRGGTSFIILEEKIQALMKKEETKYPAAVFVITDGAGDKVNPEIPHHWYIFLTREHTKDYFPKTCNFYNLEDYE